MNAWNATGTVTEYTNGLKAASPGACPIPVKVALNIRNSRVMNLTDTILRHPGRVSQAR